MNSDLLAACAILAATTWACGPSQPSAQSDDFDSTEGSRFGLEADISGTAAAKIFAGMYAAPTVGDLVHLVTYQSSEPVAWLAYPESRSSQASSYERPRLVGTRETVNGIEFYGISTREPEWMSGGPKAELEAIIWHNGAGRNHFALVRDGHDFNTERNCVQCHQGRLPLVDVAFEATSNVAQVQDALLTHHPSGSYGGVDLRTSDETAATFRSHVETNAKMARARVYWNRLCSEAPVGDEACRKSLLKAALASTVETEKEVLGSFLEQVQLPVSALEDAAGKDTYFSSTVDNGFSGANGIERLYKNRALHDVTDVVFPIAESALYGVGFTSADRKALGEMQHPSVDELDDTLFAADQVTNLRVRVLTDAGVVASHVDAVRAPGTKRVLREIQPNRNIAALLPSKLRHEDVYLKGLQAFDELCATCHFVQPRNSPYLEAGLGDASYFVRFGTMSSIDFFQKTIEGIYNYGGYHTSLGALKNYLGEPSDGNATMPPADYIDAYFGGQQPNAQRLQDLRAMLVLHDAGIPHVPNEFELSLSSFPSKVACTYGTKSTEYELTSLTISPQGVPVDYSGRWHVSYSVDSLLNGNSPTYLLVEVDFSEAQLFAMKDVVTSVRNNADPSASIAAFLNVVVKPKTEGNWALNQCRNK